MDKYVKEIKAYTFPELTGEAKEKAKEWYLNDETLSWELTNNYESDLSCIFPNSDLKVQWSLSYCQGDGGEYLRFREYGRYFLPSSKCPCLQLDQWISYRKGNPYFKVLYERVQE